MHWDITKSHKFAAAIVLAIAASTESVPLSAQQSLMLEEVIVTARKRAESLQSVPLSISAISALEIERLGIAVAQQKSASKINYLLAGSGQLNIAAEAL